eukprot:TRINITY_DN27071_c0_g1_i1.p1 TRINITY_DN27071_c0_g1~~TRINITY_DN27071_c0_g1_i1.p1  ORF type:complete len:103 (+),score=18.73 TRINITY_DN27071_c0_g1_i1:54-362(+)
MHRRIRHGFCAVFCVWSLFSALTLFVLRACILELAQVEASSLSGLPILDRGLRFSSGGSKGSLNKSCCLPLPSGSDTALISEVVRLETEVVESVFLRHLEVI